MTEAEPVGPDRLDVAMRLHRIGRDRPEGGALVGKSLWLLAIAVLVASPAARAADAHSYAVVVGLNLSVDPGVAPLRYADDDAARYVELLSPIARRVELLAVLDEETQTLYPELVRRAAAPSRAVLLERLGSVFADIARDRAAGVETTFYFIYVGHGEAGAGREGYVNLLDGHFTRSDLFREVIARSPATFNHVIIDACNSYLMVNARGASSGGLSDDSGPDRTAAIRDYLGAQSLDRYPNTGVVLSTSQLAESHEWSLFRAGVFSHEVRSALAGAADANGDGQVEYSELKAFVAAANLDVKDPRAHLDIYARPPALDAHRPLVDLGTGFTHFLRLPPDLAGRYYLEDARGVRYADFNKAQGAAMTIALVPSDYYYLRGRDTEAKTTLAGVGTADAARLVFGPIAIAARGSLSDAFQRELFRVPYSAAFYEGYVASSGDTPAHRAAREFPPSPYQREPRPQRPLLPNPY